MNKLLIATAAAFTLGSAGIASAAAHAMAPGVEASDQDVSGGTVTADSVVAPANGWLVVHRTGEDMKPGPVVGYAPLMEGDNTSVTSILQEDVASGDMLMLMVHGEEGGTSTGVFEYTLGATEDGPIKPEGELVMKVVTAQ